MPNQNNAMDARVRNVIIVVVAILVLAGGYWWYKTHERTSRLQNGVLVTAPAGDVVSQFPMELILEKSARVNESYRIEYAAGLSQPAATYVSAKTLGENVADFQKYFAESGWQVSHEAIATSTRPTFFLASRGNETVNVTFIPQQDGSIAVSIAYTAPQAK